MSIEWTPKDRKLFLNLYNSPQNDGPDWSRQLGAYVRTTLASMPLNQSSDRRNRRHLWSVCTLAFDGGRDSGSRTVTALSVHESETVAMFVCIQVAQHIAELNGTECFEPEFIDSDVRGHAIYPTWARGNG